MALRRKIDRHILLEIYNLYFVKHAYCLHGLVGFTLTRISNLMPTFSSRIILIYYTSQTCRWVSFKIIIFLRRE